MTVYQWWILVALAAWTAFNLRKPRPIGIVVNVTLPQPPGSEHADDEGWVTATLECRICTHQHVSTYPYDIDDPHSQECPRCSYYAAGPIEYHGPDDDVDPDVTKEENSPF